MQRVITDELGALLEVLPREARQNLLHTSGDGLIEIILDLGRLPEARYTQKELILSEQEITRDDVDYVVSRIGQFSGDNRAGIERTLHRISAIRNREGKIIGLTCRVGRAIFGTVKIIQDLVETGKSVLLLGRPGIGKTTMLREIARVMADDLKKRVVVVDTSNEIAGDGDIPHPAIGHARRMQVPFPTMQHAVMIEAVENHMPEVIIIDEIGTSLEADAARTIAERGVQLIGTAHGNTLENLMMNPTLSDLVGGIQSVTLGDEEARRRHTQKSILERKAPPTFSILVEMQERDRVLVHPDVVEAVDSILKNTRRRAEIRWIAEDGSIKKGESVTNLAAVSRGEAEVEISKYRIYLFGVNRNRLEEAARDRHIALKITADIKEANLLLTTKTFYLRKPQIIRDAEKRGIPIYAVKSGNLAQLKQCLDNIYWRKKDAAQGHTGDKPGEYMSDIYGELTHQNARGSFIRQLQKAMSKGNHEYSAGRREGRRMR
ncbi:MAG TPA: AAA family ATPase [Dehalococcoidia bacterium]|nr:AAA family ATPase [Dehalococcoidia bacterium]